MLPQTEDHRNGDRHWQPDDLPGAVYFANGTGYSVEKVDHYEMFRKKVMHRHLYGSETLSRTV